MGIQNLPIQNKQQQIEFVNEKFALNETVGQLLLAKGGVDIFGKKWDYPCPDNW